MDTAGYLTDGEQTKVTQLMTDIVASLPAEPLDAVFGILQWLHKNIKPKQGSEYENEWFRKRTAADIISSGFTTGCTDYALVFIALTRAKRIPAKYVETVRTDWLATGNLDQIEGHVFVEVFVNNAWRIIDPQGAEIRAWYGKQYKIVATGLDSWDIGITNLQTLREKFAEFLETHRA